MSLRLVRSPEAPNMTSVNGSGAPPRFGIGLRMGGTPYFAAFLAAASAASWSGYCVSSDTICL